MARKVIKKHPPHGREGMRVILWDESPAPAVSSSQSHAKADGEDHEEERALEDDREMAVAVCTLHHFTTGDAVYPGEEDMTALRFRILL